MAANELKLDPLPYSPWDQDVRIWRADGVVHTSVPHSVIWHSPDGFEYGYAGSGPADLALNILNAFVPPSVEDSMPCFRGCCSCFAAIHHQQFKAEFITPIKGSVEILKAETIRAWIAQRSED
jgi:hypothetical protein